MHDEVARGLEQAITACKQLGARVVERPAPWALDWDDLSWVLMAEVWAYHRAHAERHDRYREQVAEFVEAAHMVGASNGRILRRHLVPHLAPTLLVWAGVAIGTNILAEVGLSFLGVGVQPSTPSLGSLLSTVWGTIFNPRNYDSHAYTPWQTIFPMVTIVLTVVCLNRFSEAVRRALEPRVTR